MTDVKASSHLDQLIRDAREKRDEISSRWTRNLNLYEGKHASVFGVYGADAKHYAIVNRVQPAVVAQVAIQTENRPRPVYSGRETNERPIIYVSRLGAAKFSVMSEDEIGAVGLTPEQIEAEEPISDDQHDMLMRMTDEQEVPKDPERVKIEAEIAKLQMGNGENERPEAVSFVEITQTPRFNDQDFIYVTDEMAAKALTEEVSRQWDDANGDILLECNIKDKAVLGDKDTLIQWDADEMRFTMENLYNWDVYFDPLAHGSHDAQYVIIARVYDAKRAISEYPDFEEAIDKAKGDLTRGEASRRSGPRNRYTNRSNRERDLVAIWHLWEKDHPFPVEPDEAVEQGLVVPQTQPVMDEFGEPLIDLETGEVVEEPAIDEEGELIYATAEGLPTSYNDPSWPKYYGIRQLTMIGDAVVEDIESEFPDIPVARNINLPRVESPYGIGDPEILEDLQQLYNKLNTILQEHFYANRHSNIVMPKSVYDQMREAMKKLHSSTFTQVVVPDNLIQMTEGGINGIVSQINPPQISQSISFVLQQVSQELDRLGGTVDALRGELKSETSGRALANAVTAARGPIGYKARHTQEYLRYISKLIAFLTIEYLPEDVWAERSSKYSTAVIRAIKAKLKKLTWDIKVEIGAISDRDRRIDATVTMVQNMPAAQSSPTLIANMLDDLGVAEAEKVGREISGAAVNLNNN